MTKARTSWDAVKVLGRQVIHMPRYSPTFLKLVGLPLAFIFWLSSGFAERSFELLERVYLVQVPELPRVERRFVATSQMPPTASIQLRTEGGLR